MSVTCTYHGHVSHFNAKMGEWSIKDTISLFASACPSIIKKELTTGMTDMIINDKPEPFRNGTPGTEPRHSGWNLAGISGTDRD